MFVLENKYIGAARVSLRNQAAINGVMFAYSVSKRMPNRNCDALLVFLCFHQFCVGIFNTISNCSGYIGVVFKRTLPHSFYCQNVSIS